MAAVDQRIVGLELLKNAVAFKALVDALSTAIDAINTTVSAWTLTGADNALPAALVVKEQLAAYNDIVSPVKPGVTLSDSVAVINAAT